MHLESNNDEFAFNYRYDFAIDSSKPTLTPKKPFDGQLGQRDNWSESDINQVNRYYKCYQYTDILGPDGKKEQISQ